MREIKFRAWDKHNKVMLDRVLAGCNQDNDSYVCNLVWVEDKKDWLHFDEGCGEIMQYTGLKDRNGVEIFEGDIFMPRYNDFRPNVVVYEDGRYNISFFRVENCEVIGNIYENPELLGGAK